MTMVSRVINRRVICSFAGAFLFSTGAAVASVDIEQQPLLVAQPVPGNMSFVGSFEFPTMVSKANNGVVQQNRDQTYALNNNYIGYFDSAKCYAYHFHASGANNQERLDNSYFYPVNTDGPSCSGNQWSGHYLNWASMQAIDIFRSVMTGGYRSVDTPSETILEKGVQTGQGQANNFPIGQLSNSNLIAGASPVTWSRKDTRVLWGGQRMGNLMLFRNNSTWGTWGQWTPYNPAVHTNPATATTYAVAIRVRVCVPGMLEENCEQYRDGYKPEGLIQANAENMRYNAFSYLNDDTSGSGNRNREGGVMHSRMKYVGPTAIDDNNNEIDNPYAEWNKDTGVFIPNPVPEDASATTYANRPVQHSGVISYINNAGQIVPDTLFKRFDNISELYYAAYRYLKGLDNVPEYSNVSDRSGDFLDQLIGGLPIITDWQKEDPIQFWCQRNFILGIGDTNTHPDDRIPKAGDPLTQAQLNTLRTNINTMEGGFNPAGSGYIAALAYDANTRDLRPNMEGRQTASTYWIDILEYGDLKARTRNMYWLAAKYGGFDVPEEFNPSTRTVPFPDAWWHTTGDILPGTNDKRPDNFYVVDNAEQMVQSLVQAFADIQQEQSGNRSSLALNTTSLEAGAATFQAQYTSGAWLGDLRAFSIDPDTRQISTTPAWSAQANLPAWDSRNIKVNAGGSMVDFRYNNLTDPQKTALTNADLVDFLRGERANEGSPFRLRQGVLGDIVNSQPVFVGAPEANRFRGRSFTGLNSYPAFANAQANRLPVVYVGSNDGMLHGFDGSVGAPGGDGGRETFAFIPSTVIENGLAELADRDYDHRYFVDGEIAVADVYTGGAWRTVLVGTLGAGGVAKNREDANNSVFALDVTDPNNVSFLWEVSTEQVPALGANIGRPVIAQVADGQWRVLLGNGFNSTDGAAALISINIANGTPTTTTMSGNADNGLSAVRAWDSTGDGFTDTVYAGDQLGSIWKVNDLNGSFNVQELFRSVGPDNNPQPVTAAPVVARDTTTGRTWIFYGTGRYINNSDLTDTSVQSWYGIVDNNTLLSRGDDLIERRILADIPVGDVTARVIEAGAREDLVDKSGWYIDLFQLDASGNRSRLGERMITPNQFQGRSLIGNTRIPDASDACAPTGRGVIMAIDPFTGARLTDTFFDLNRDGSFDDMDRVMIDGVLTIVSGIGFNTGFSNPSFLDGSMFIPFDDTTTGQIDTNIPTSGVGRTSWREIINIGN